MNDYEIQKIRDTAFCSGYNTAVSKYEKQNKELQEENAELKADNDARKFAMAMSEKVEKQLREENAELKADYKVLSCSVGDFGELQDKLEEEQRKNNALSDNLTKAKKLIERLLITSCNSDVLNLLPNCSEVLQARVEAEQFLSEVEK